ncbi:preprotein translocase subunit SecD [Thermacetogenium phaeum DSM 12270]|uniref:Protein translocase subunit SecD n=1 Tax=Thermacetogenium phaeum (strain ATCC BAA-254 / DSM 26808 / PB) TaxID=1089553 RepID=K4LHB3_THEPS|nr:protein translocase subunit SecD [Thermacetogenium phaeum]AFV11462.1 preprotein translocase subunit SecD [Thermacetogenium phaeum DSM 12270]
MSKKERQKKKIAEKQQAVSVTGKKEKNAGINWGVSTLFFLLVGAILCVAVFSIKPLAGQLQKHLGLDLRGGVHVVYQAVPTKEAPVTADSIDRLIAIFNNRVNAYGLTEPLIQKQGSDRVIVELPGVKDPEEAVEMLGRMAKLEFKTEDGKTVLTGRYLSDARAQLNPNNNEPEVVLKFDKEGARIFSEVTTANVGRRIAIYLDERLLTAPVVRDPIPDGNAVISGGYETLEEAQKEAILLRSGALPVNVKLLEKRSVGPTLGKESLERSLKAGIIGVALIFIFMILYYRWPGVIANLSLIVYGLIVISVFLLFKATLTLPGIAGFILSIGMAVDSNIIIYERLKEELRAGKTLRSAIDAGFYNAFRAILDANVTTLIAAGVLYYLGSGPIRGFAITLSIGILVSMFTAITFTRFVLHLVARSRLVVNPKAYGV